MNKTIGFIRIIRPINSLMVGFSIIVGAALSGGFAIFEQPIVLLYSFITGFSMTGASMTINDYYDREIDAINEPNRPIPSGLVTPREALIITVFLSALGLLTSWMINFQALGLAFLALVLLIMYSSWGKKTGFLGNLMVSSCISMPFIYGGFLSGLVQKSLIFSLIAFLVNTGREITKGIVDVEGDKQGNVSTIAVVFGNYRAAQLASLFFMAAIMTSVIPVYFDFVSVWYLPFIVITDLGLIWGSNKILKNPSRENSRNVKNLILKLMLIGLIGFTAGSLL
jgi:geranylgeranylglycerol-phosphate geranylgeranyltransferase